jgi:hypothetical protein
MHPSNCLRVLLASALFGLLAAGCTTVDQPPKKVGVLLLVHGGTEHSETSQWDSTLQIFFYDPNSFVYQRIIWNKAAWPMILSAGNAPKEQGKYAFEHDRIGDQDFTAPIFEQQTRDLRAELEAVGDELNTEFVVDYINWIGDIPHLPSPRLIYNPPTARGATVNYCGEGLGDDPDEPMWKNCDPERYNQDGSIDRMLKAGVDEIVIIDLTTSGVRFFKSYDVIRTSRELVAEHNERTGSAVTVRWLNDPADLMRRSYPDVPANWTNGLGAPEHDPRVSLMDAPNPVSSDKDFAVLHALGVKAQLNPAVAPEKTGVMLVNHATRRFNQLFDPKIDDTLVLNDNIRDALLKEIPGLKNANIVGSWMGIKELNTDIQPKPPSFSQYERTRRMRGENLGHAYLYETDEQFPEGQWGYLYWDALEQLKNQGMEHIVIAFPQITVDSVLNVVELPNQIGKELGYKTWLHIDSPDFKTYPGAGHPFADYWGIWVDRECKASPEEKSTYACCFEMGGCSDGRPYPPPRQTPFSKARDDMDPSLAYDVSEYGHLGYDPKLGKPDANRPVQRQYIGTWATWNPPNDDPRVGKFLAKHVINDLLSRP